jgi:mevalonate kinase
MELFKSKILLFGEYSLLYGSNALALPFGSYSGKLKFNSEKENTSNASIKAYVEFLQKNKVKYPYLNIRELEQDVKNGLYFDSNISQNYGLGSSGALVAALFHNYKNLGDSGKNDVNELKIILGNMESWFHGKSSGIDPLVSYLNKPVLFRNSIIEVIDFIFNDDDFKIFLVDTGIESSTSFQVRSFQQLIKNKMFYYVFLENYIPYINSAISFFLEKKYFNFHSIMIDIIDFQLKYFKILFPSNTRELIKEGIEDELYYLKLCGSGGGGFLLGFTQDIEKTRKHLSLKNVNIIEVGIE